MNSEYAYLRAPYEELSSVFRTNKRKIEKELSFALSHLKNMNNHRFSLDKQQALGSLQGLSSRLTQFKEKMLELYDEEDKWIQICEQRLNSLSNCSESEKTKILRLITEHYTRQDKFDFSQSLSEKAKIKPLTEIYFFQKSKKIKADMANKDLTSALEWCDSHKSKLKKLGSPLEFNLKLQKFIEFIKENNNCGGILYARSHLSKYPQHQKEIQKAMMLLVVMNRPSEFEEYQSLLDDSKWVELINLFEAEYLKVYSLSTESSLGILLRSGFIALKNPLCESKNKAKDCPLCNSDFQKLAKSIPYACHSHTSMICRILRVVMDEHNPPVALPNGQVYSEEGVKKITQDSKIVCPSTGVVFNSKQVSKLFIV